MTVLVRWQCWSYRTHCIFMFLFCCVRSQNRQLKRNTDIEYKMNEKKRRSFFAVFVSHSCKLNVQCEKLCILQNRTMCALVPSKIIFKWTAQSQDTSSFRRRTDTQKRQGEGKETKRRKRRMKKKKMLHPLQFIETHSGCAWVRSRSRSFSENRKLFCSWSWDDFTFFFLFLLFVLVCRQRSEQQSSEQKWKWNREEENRKKQKRRDEKKSSRTMKMHWHVKQQTPLIMCMQFSTNRRRHNTLMRFVLLL